MTGEELKEALLIGRPVEWRGLFDTDSAIGSLDAIIYTRGDSPGKIKVSARIVDTYGRLLTCRAEELHPIEGGIQNE